MQPELELPVALHRGEFVAASALMEFHGVPIDMEIFPQLADHMPGATYAMRWCR